MTKKLLTLDCKHDKLDIALNNDSAKKELTIKDHSAKITKRDMVFEN